MLFTEVMGIVAVVPETIIKKMEDQVARMERMERVFIMLAITS